MISMQRHTPLKVGKYHVHMNGAGSMNHIARAWYEVQGLHQVQVRRRTLPIEGF